MRSFEGGIGRLRSGSMRGGDVPALKDELGKKDEELLVSVERINTLKGR